MQVSFGGALYIKTATNDPKQSSITKALSKDDNFLVLESKDRDLLVLSGESKKDYRGILNALLTSNHYGTYSLTVNALIDAYKKSAIQVDLVAVHKQQKSLLQSLRQPAKKKMNLKEPLEKPLEIHLEKPIKHRNNKDFDNK